MSFTARDIAKMLIEPSAGCAFVVSKISSDWETIDPQKELSECLEEIVHNYSQLIDTEIGWDRERKILAASGEVVRRIRAIEKSS